jgi:hypothetical protein
MLLLVVAAAYFAVGIGEAYLRFYRFRDAMEQQARFAENAPDREIVANLQAKADSLGLPDEAYEIDVRRARGSIVISSDYAETVDFPLVRRTIRFTPRVERTF